MHSFPYHLHILQQNDPLLCHFHSGLNFSISNSSFSFCCSLSFVNHYFTLSFIERLCQLSILIALATFSVCSVVSLLVLRFPLYIT